MFTKACILLLLQLWLVIGYANAEGISITVPSAVRVEGAFITLGQLADIRGDDVARVNRLGQLKLGSTPSPSKSIVLTREFLGMRLAATGSDFSGITWNIPDNITVTTNFQVVRGQILNDKVIDDLKGRAGVGAASGELSITPISNALDVIIPVGQLELTSYFPYGIRYNAPTAAQITMNVNGQVFTKINLQFDVKLYRQVAVATSQMSKGELLTTEKLRYERMDTGHLESGYYTDVTQLIGLETRRSLTPGMVVTDSMVNKPVLIKRGDRVNIIARIGSMEVTTAGQAMQNGIEGQLIRVQNINSKKNISAQVLDASNVEVLTYNKNGV